MPVLITIQLLLGVALILLGYLIRFQGLHSLLGSFEEQLRRGRVDAGYAGRIGLVLFVGGFLLLATSLATVRFGAEVGVALSTILITALLITLFATPKHDRHRG
ncbi:MAG: hypothetical protein QM270_08465 [Bacillota bacterium]|nr:hypothetical protein [Bacillota bacterium]